MEDKVDPIVMLGNLHYQICNGGWSQACGNGYVDEIFTEFGSYYHFKEAVLTVIEEADSKTRSAVNKMLELIGEAIDKTEMVESCSNCGGEGSWTEEEENEDGEREETEVYCDYCNGDGYTEVENYSDVSFYDGFNMWEDKWDSKYYNTVDSDTIDDLTSQSHTHSVVLDMLKSKNESIRRRRGKRMDESRPRPYRPSLDDRSRNRMHMDPLINNKMDRERNINNFRYALYFGSAFSNRAITNDMIENALRAATGKTDVSGSLIDNGGSAKSSVLIELERKSANPNPSVNQRLLNRIVERFIEPRLESYLQMVGEDCEAFSFTINSVELYLVDNVDNLAEDNGNSLCFYAELKIGVSRENVNYRKYSRRQLQEKLTEALTSISTFLDRKILPIVDKEIRRVPGIQR